MILKDVDAEYALSQMIHEIERAADKLGDKDDYVLGQKTAYVEVLEILQRWDKSSLYGLDYNIEIKYPIFSDK